MNDDQLPSIGGLLELEAHAATLFFAAALRRAVEVAFAIDDHCCLRNRAVGAKGLAAEIVDRLVLPSSGTALAQLEITPGTSITPSSHVTSWIFQMAVASVILAVLVLIGFTLAYLRFAPAFSGREGKKPAAPPGSRPAELTRQAAAMRWTPPTAPSGTQATAAPAVISTMC